MIHRRPSLFAALLLAGCASAPPTSPLTSDPATPHDRALAPLTRDAARRSAPDPNAQPGRVPGIEPGSLDPIPADAPEFARAARSLDSVLDEFAASPPRAPSGEIGDPEAREAALRRYVRGRAMLLDGDVPGAIAELKQATTLDPGSVEPWRELGEAYLLAGQARDAESAFAAADERGDLGPRGLEVLARAAEARNRHDEAARFLARALRAGPERADPLLAPVLHVRLGSILTSLGFTRAGLESTTRALTRPAELTASTRYGNDYGAIFRRRADLWRSVGDAHCRLGEPAAALRAYEQASILPAADGTSLLPRLVHAALAAGQPERAAILSLRALADHPLDPSVVPVLRHVAARPDLRPRIVDALAALRADLAAEGRAVRSALVRAQASLQEPREARRTLRDQLRSDPADPPALAMYLGMLDSTARAAAAADLVSRRPASADTVADALLAAQPDPDALAASLLRAGPSGRLTAAHVLASAGLPARARRALDEGAVPRDAQPVADLLTIVCAIQSGTLDSAAAARDRLASGTTPLAIRAHARALASLALDADALERARAVLASPGPAADRIDDLVFAAALVLRAPSPETAADAERWLEEARRIDPTDDRPIGPLLDLYSTGGPRADPSRAAALAREFRLAFPDSRAIRVRRAADALRRGMFDQAEPLALELADQDPSDAISVGMLTSAWEQRAARDGAASLVLYEDWVRRQLAARPGSPALVAAACVLALAKGDKPAAEAVARDAIDRGAGQDVRRILERLLRDRLGRPDEADSLALARLQGRTLVPAEAIDLAELHIRAQRPAPARDALAATITPRVTLGPDAIGRLIDLADGLSKAALDDRRNFDAASATLLILDLVTARDAKFGPELHDRRLALLARADPLNADRLIAAADRCSATFPQLKGAPHLRAASLLLEEGKGQFAAAVVARGAELPDAITPEFAVAWFRIVALAGTIDQARAMILRLHAAGQLSAILAQLQTTQPPPDPRSEAAYILGNLIASSARHDLADAAYELALEFDPDHPWACNNLGYSLADRGKDIERASDLLERAFRRLPEEPAIIDSLGWLRYKQGRILDTLDPDTGTVTARGAVSLLQAAAMTDHGQTDPTILHHLADALWLANRGEEALRYWSLAERVAQRQLDADRPNPRLPADEQRRQLSEATTVEYRTIVDLARAKQAAARANLPVRVAPQYDNPDPRPVDH